MRIPENCADVLAGASPSTNPDRLPLHEAGDRKQGAVRLVAARTPAKASIAMPAPRLKDGVADILDWYIEMSSTAASAASTSEQ